MFIRGFALLLIFANVSLCLADIGSLPGHMTLGNGKFPNLIPNFTRSGLPQPKERHHEGTLKNHWNPKLQVLPGAKRLDDEKAAAGLGLDNAHGFSYDEEGDAKYAIPDLRIFNELHKNSIHKDKERVGHKGHGSHLHSRHGAHGGNDGGVIFDSVLEIVDAVLRKTQIKMKELLDREMRSREAIGKPPPRKHSSILSIIPFLKRIQRMHRTPNGLPDPLKAISTVIGVLKDASAAGALREQRSRGTRGFSDPLESLKAVAELKPEDLKAVESLLQPDSGKCACSQWADNDEGKNRKCRSEEKRPERTRNEILRSVGARSSELALDAIDQVTSRLYRMVVGFLG